MNHYKACTRCGQTLPLDDFSKQKSGKSGFRAPCRQCCRVEARAYREAHPEAVRESKRAWAHANREKANAMARAYYEANPEVAKAGQRAWAKANPEAKRNRSSLRNSLRRARIAENGIFLVTAKDIARLLRQPCAYCGAVAEHIDHVVPIARGGAHKIGNLVAACSSCNLRKGSKLVSIWRLGNASQQEKVDNK